MSQDLKQIAKTVKEACKGIKACPLPTKAYLADVFDMLAAKGIGRDEAKGILWDLHLANEIELVRIDLREAVDGLRAQAGEIRLFGGTVTFDAVRIETIAA